MRSAGNFSPEWGYLAPAPSFMRTARVVLVATAIGATAGAGVVLSLVDHPAADGEKMSVAAHAIVTAVQAAPGPARTMTAAPVAAAAAVNVPPAAQAQTPGQSPVRISIPAAAPRAALASQSPALASPQPAADTASPAPPSAPGIAALSDAPVIAPADAPDQTTMTPDAGPPQKKTKHKNRPFGIGPVLRRLFSAHSGASYYPNRGL
jgi:hypothetical protein